MSLMAAPLQKLPVLREDVPACSTQTWIQTLIQTARGRGWPKRSQNVAINAWDIAAERKVRESVKTRLESVLLHHADSLPSWWVSIWESWWTDGVLRCWYVKNGPCVPMGLLSVWPSSGAMTNMFWLRQVSSPCLPLNPRVDKSSSAKQTLRQSTKNPISTTCLGNAAMLSKYHSLPTYCLFVSSPKLLCAQVTSNPPPHWATILGTMLAICHQGDPRESWSIATFPWDFPHQSCQTTRHWTHQTGQFLQQMFDLCASCQAALSERRVPPNFMVHQMFWRIYTSQLCIHSTHTHHICIGILLSVFIYIHVSIHPHYHLVN